jgi:hypothetical protein
VRQRRKAAMSFLPRPRQSCRVGAADTRQGQDSRLKLNRVFLSGVLADDPQDDLGRDGNPIALLLVAYPAPDPRDTQRLPETAISEIEVPASVFEQHGKELRVGAAIFVTGQLSGGGGVLATEIHSGPPPDRD